MSSKCLPARARDAAGHPREVARVLSKHPPHHKAAAVRPSSLQDVNATTWGRIAGAVVARHTFRSVGYLSHPDLEPEFLAHVTTRMRVAIYSRLEGINVIPAAISSSLAVPSLAYECAGSKHGPELKHALLSPRFLLSVANRSPAYSSWTEASAPSKERFALLAHAWART